MRKLIVGLGVVAVLAGACSYQLGHTLTVGEGGELISLVTRFGVDRNDMEDIMELGGEDEMDEEMSIVLSGLLYPDRVTDEDFASAVLSGDLLGPGGIVPDATSEVEIKRWQGEDGYAYVSATMSPDPGSVPVREIDPDTGEIAGGEGDLWRSGLHKNGAIRIESTLHRTMTPNSEMLGDEDMSDMLETLLEVDFYMEIIAPYPISETNGTVMGGEDSNVVIWEWSQGDANLLPEVFYMETEPPDGSSPIWWIAVIVLALALSGYLVLRETRSTKSDL